MNIEIYGTRSKKDGYHSFEQNKIIFEIEELFKRTTYKEKIQIVTVESTVNNQKRFIKIITTIDEKKLLKKVIKKIEKIGFDIEIPPPVERYPKKD